MDNELYDVKEKSQPKFVMGKCIVNKFITLTRSDGKTHIRADRITQIYETKYGTYVYLDGDNTFIIAKESADEVFAKIREIY